VKRACSFLLVALLAAPATAGEVSGLAAVDVFHADSMNPGPAAGAPDFASGQELGLNLKLRFSELDDDLQVRLHYRGREPLPGEVQNAALRTLYEAWVSYEVWDDVVTAKAGRFLVPSPVFLALDGAAVKVELPLGLETSVFGGRRGLTTSRREAGIDKWLLAGGGSFGWRHELVQTFLHVNYAQDEAVLLKAGQETTATHGGVNLLGTVFSRPFDWLMLGGQLAFVQQANYVIGPTWAEAAITNEVINLLNAMAWTEWRPLKLVRVTYDFHFQRPQLVRSGTLEGTDETLTDELVDPNFMDNRIKLGVSPFAIGWMSGGVRHRLRPERHELRYFAELDVNHLVPWGFYANGQVIWEQILHHPDFAANAKEMDRLLGTMALGWTGFGFDVSTGLSYIERAGTPLSSRTGQAATPADLSPFVLEAQRLFFVRTAYNTRWFFTAFDFERNIDDNEYRAFAQVGGYLELGW
jgi:hypothetical protein